MSYEMQDVVQESPAAQAIESPSLFGEAYALLSPQQFKGNDQNQTSSRNDVSQAFGTLELFDSQDGAHLGQSGETVNKAAADAAGTKTSVADRKSADSRAESASDPAGARTSSGDRVVGDAGVAVGKANRLETIKIVGEYRGEVINRDVEPSTAVATKENGLKKIAREHLGTTPPPTEEEVARHVKEIARINNIKNPDSVPDGTRLELPGHTKDGGFVSKDAVGDKRTVWQDGVVRFDNADRSGYVFRPGENGAYSEHHWGLKPQDNYELRRTADGRYEVADAGKDNFKEVPADAKDPRVERAKLRDVADALISDPKERAKFEAEMARFETRSKDLQQTYEKQGMTPEEASKRAQKEITETYGRIRKLMETPDGPNVPIKQADRILLAEQIMHQAADPTDVSQGFHNTCNVATIESRAYASSPSEAARLVTDIATTGKYESNGKPPVTLEVGKQIDANSLLKQGESAKPHEPGANHRSYASQIFEVAAVNIHYAKENAKTNPPGQVRYEQHKPNPDAKDPDTGERLLDYSKIDPKTGKPAELMRAPGLTPSDIARVGMEITPAAKDGNLDGPLVLKSGFTKSSTLEIDNKEFARNLERQGVGDGQPLNLSDPKVVEQTRQAIDRSRMTPQEKEQFKQKLNDLERANAYDLQDGVAVISSEKQLNQALQRLSDQGRLPIVVAIHTGKEPFNGSSGTGGLGGEHVITVTEYIPGNPPRVRIDNQWTQLDDTSIPVSKLFESMKDYDHINKKLELQKEVDENRKAGKPDFEKEGELMKERRLLNELKDSDVTDGMLKMYEEALKLKSEGKLSREQEEKLTRALKALGETLPPEEVDRFNKRKVDIDNRHRAKVKPR